MAKKKSSVDEQKLTNSMSQLVAGVIPGSQKDKTARSPNAINAIDSLQMQVRGDWITMNYMLLSFLYQQFGLIQGFIEIPVLDAFRGGIKFSAYEKKVVTPEKKHRVRFKFWNAEDSKPSGQTDKDFMIEQMKRREEWEKEQVAKDEAARKAEDA